MDAGARGQVEFADGPSDDYWEIEHHLLEQYSHSIPTRGPVGGTA
jgi:hypothetical protein